MVRVFSRNYFRSMKKAVLILVGALAPVLALRAQSFPVAVITASGPLEFCQGDSVVLSTPAGTDFNYQWKRNEADILNATRPTYTARQSGFYSVVVTKGDSYAADNVRVRVLEPKAGNITGLPFFCAGGSTTLTATGTEGQGPYSYQWKQGSAVVGNAGAYVVRTGGDYTVTTTDARGCVSLPALVTVREDPKPMATAGPDVVVTGNQRYTVAGATTTGSGIYWTTDPPVPVENAVTLAPTIGPFTTNTTLIMTVNGGGECGAVARAKVVYTACTFNAKLRTQGVICRGEADTLGVQFTGGNGDYVYAWQRNGAPVSEEPRYVAREAGTYSVTVTDSKGCTAVSDRVTLVESPTPAVGIAGEAAFCKGSSTVLTASASGGTAPYAFAWKNGAVSMGTANPLTATTVGVYAVTVTDANGCTVTSAARAVTEKGGDIVALIVPVGPTNAFSPVTLNASAGLGYAYQWRKNGQAIAGATASSYVVNEPGEGNYAVAISRDGCTVVSASVAVSVLVPTGLEPAPADFGVRVFPNPTAGRLWVEITLDHPAPATITLRDQVGRRLGWRSLEQPATRHAIGLDLDGFSEGFYLLETESGSHRAVRKVLKTN